MLGFLSSLLQTFNKCCSIFCCGLSFATLFSLAITEYLTNADLASSQQHVSVVNNFKMPSKEDFTKSIGGDEGLFSLINEVHKFNSFSMIPLLTKSFFPVALLKQKLFSKLSIISNSTHQE